MKPGRPAAGRPAQPARPPGEVRIIGGQWKRSRLPVPDRPGLRPTPDRVRETLFNWLGQDLSGWRVLDAFAGSGALGFEAASRGAAEVLLLEHDAAVARSLEATRQRLHADTVQVLRADALAWLGRCAPGRFELVLLDPPFAADLAQTALRLALPVLAEGGFVYVEAGEAPAEALPGATLHRSLKAGAVSAQLWRRGT